MPRNGQPKAIFEITPSSESKKKCHAKENPRKEEVNKKTENVLSEFIR